MVVQVYVPGALREKLEPMPLLMLDHNNGITFSVVSHI